MSIKETMTKQGKIIVFGGTTVIIAIVAILIFAVDWADIKMKKEIRETIDEQEIDSEDFIDRTLSTKEVRDIIPSRPLDESQTQGWNKYVSQKLGISFKYPPNYLVVEVEDSTTPSIGTSVSIAVMEDTPHNQSVAKKLNSNFDYDVPESFKNVDIEPGQGINLSKSVASGFTQDIMQWFEEGGIQIGDHAVYAPSNFIGMDSVLFQGEGLYIFDGVIFEREGYLYQFDVQHYDSPESPRSDFYKIISTVEFK